VPQTLRKLGIPGFRIPAFIRGHDGSYSDPADYPRMSLTQPATHDHPPLAAAWAECWRNIDAGHHAAENQRELRHVMRFAGLATEPAPRDFVPGLHEAYLRRVAHSHSRLVVVMITDVFGQTERFNTPGDVSDGNWSTRIEQTVAELEQEPHLRAKAETFARLMQEAGRGLKSSP
jgi:4-alpha-glucanotransferase